MAKRKDGRYDAQVYLGKDENGKRIAKTVYGKTQREADQKAIELRVKYNKGIDLKRQRDTFKAWLDIWFSIKKSEVSEKHYTNMQSTAKHLETLYYQKITDIRPYDIKLLLSDLAKENSNTNKPASKKLLKDVKSIINQVYAEAIDNRVVEFNPVQNIKIQKSAPVSKREPISKEQIKWIIETEHNARPAAMLMLFAGLRRGEAVPLLWSDIDFKNNTININKSVSYPTNEPVVKLGAKSESGVRSINMPDVLSDYLKNLPRKGIYVISSDRMLTEGAWKRMWESYMDSLDALYGIRVNNDRPCRKGKAPNEPVSKFDPHKGPMIIKNFTAHQLRHTYATMLYDAGVDILTAQYLLGHSDVKTTLDIYTHLQKTRKEHSISNYNDYLTGVMSNSSQSKTAEA